MRSLARSRVLSIATAAAVAAGLILLGSPATADTSPPAGTPATVSTDVLPTVQIDGVVWDQEISGNTAYAGGDFQRARPAGAAAGVNTVARRYLLRYNLQTGVMDGSWNPNPNARIRNMAVSPDGSRVYVVGSFTSIAGATRYRVASFNTATGALTSFAPVLNGKVHAVAATNSTVYLVGGFTTANGAAVSGAAAYDAVTGARKTGWAPRIGGGQAIAATVKSDGTQVAIGGYFTSVNGSSNPGYGLALVRGDNGANLPFAVNSRVRNAGSNAAISSLTSDAGGVYGTGQHYGTGTLEGTFYAAWSTGAIIWVEDCHGDTYSAYAAANVVYTTSHAHYCGNIGGFPQTNPWGFHRGLAFTKTVGGTITKDPLGYTNWQGTPRPNLLHWFPDINAGSFTGLNQGGWSVAGNSQYILYGGEFTRVNNVPQQGIVRFAVSDIAADKDGPRVTGANFAPTLSSPAANQVRVTWKANWDRDNTRLTYQVIRDANTTTPRYTTTANSNFWTLPTMTYTDTVAAGTHRYRIRAIDPFGNAQSSTDVSINVPGAANLQAADDLVTEEPAPVAPAPAPAPAGSYAEDVAGDSPANYWRLDETGGTTAVDSAGGANASASGGVTFGTAGAVGSGTAAIFNGTGLLSTQNAVQGPNAFAVEAWFKTTSTTGGKIVGFGNAKTGDSTMADRHLYLDASGKVAFGVYPGSRRIVQSGAGLNDGQWHHVVGNLGPAGMELYVDGTRVGQRTDTTSAQAFAGYWRIGGDRTWAGSPYFTGAIDEVAVYRAPLTADQVASHYASAGR